MEIRGNQLFSCYFYWIDILPYKQRNGHNIPGAEIILSNVNLSFRPMSHADATASAANKLDIFERKMAVVSRRH